MEAFLQLFKFESLEEAAFDDSPMNPDSPDFCFSVSDAPVYDERGSDVQRGITFQTCTRAGERE